MSVPEDVLIDILSSLPAESIIRFRCVSKHWSFLTQNPDFIAAHLSRSNSNEKDDDDDDDDDFSLVSSREEEFTGKLVCISGADFMVRKEAEIPLKSRDGDNQQREYWPLYGSCNGVLCVTTGRLGAGIALWNPAIGQVKLVPPIGRSSPLEFDFVDSSIGFGYDSKTNDYKILRLIQFGDEDRGVNIRYTYLYSLATDSWKELHPFPLIYMWRQNSVHIDGVFYWQGQSETGEDAIISFEMVDEKFHELAVPALRFLWWSIANLKGSLAFCGYEVGNVLVLDIWVLNTDGESWTRLHKITSGFQPPLPIALGQRKHGELIFMKHPNAIVLFDPQTQETRNLGNRMKIDHCCYLWTYTYKASLVTLKGAVELEEHGFCNMILDPYL